MNCLVRAFTLAALVTNVVFAADSSTGVLGTPADGGTVSGVGVISGYHCSSTNIEVFVDGVSLGRAGAGTTLKGTQSVCGHTETGYSLLYAFNNLANGQHTFTVTADGAVFDSHTVTTIQSGGQPWLSGNTATYTLQDFPQAGWSATVTWVESYQNFVVSAVTAPQNPSQPNLSALNGSHYQYAMSTVTGWGCSALGMTPGPGFTDMTVAAQDTKVAVFIGEGDVGCNLDLTYQTGDTATGVNLTGTLACNNYYAWSGVATITSLVRAGAGWSGTMVLDLNGGCTGTAVLNGRL
jgi:hypothetical protein